MYKELLNLCKSYNAKLIVVSKNQPIEKIVHLYNLGQRDFAENRVQNLLNRYETLPKDIKWHMIGHLQTNKIKYIIPFIHMIHSVDSIKLWQEINKQAKSAGRSIPVLLQIKIAQEETKYGFSAQECYSLIETGEYIKMNNTQLCGLMGMASQISNPLQIHQEFQTLKIIMDDLKTKLEDKNQFKELSMGMSSDYSIALMEGSTMIRIGSAIFEEIN